MAIKDWTQKNFYGGFSDDRFMGTPSSFRYAKAVEIRKNPNSLTLAYKPEAETISLSNNGEINALVTIKSTGDIIAFCADGKIFRNATGAGTWVNCYTDTGSSAILNAFEYNDYLYWFTSGNIHRIAISDIDGDWSGDVTEDYKTFTNGNSNAHPAIELNNKLYIGDGYYLAELDSFGVFTGDKLEIFNDEEIRALTFGGAVMRIFSRKSTKAKGGHKYLWDGTSLAYNQRLYFDQTIHTAFSDGGIDYVLAGVRPFLYRSAGYELQPIKRLPLIYDSETLFIAPNAIDMYDNLLVFGTAESGNGSIGRGVWTYGREDMKYPYSLNFDYPTSNDNTTDTINCVHNANGVLYFSWKKADGTCGLDKVNTSKFATTGSLHSRVMYGDKAAQEKQAMAIQAAFYKMLSGEKIEIFMRKNLAINWESIAELSVEYSNEDDRDIYFKRLDDALDIGDFNFLETKIKLTAGDSQATTPELTELSVEFDDYIEQGD